MTDALPRIERTLWLPADPGSLWRLLTDGALVSTWFEAPVTLEPRRGGRIETSDGGIRRWGTIEEIEEPQVVQWSWRTDDGDPSLVRIRLVPEDDGTRIEVTETLLEYETSFHPVAVPGGSPWLPHVPVDR